LCHSLLLILDGVDFEELRKQIREEQLHYESSLRWPLSPHAPRLKDSSEDDESDYYAAAESEATAGATEFPPPDSDAASSSDAGSSTPRKKNKREARRIRYSLFHYDLPRHVTPPTPPTRSTTPDAPKEYSFPVTVRTPAYSKISPLNPHNFALPK
jgi:hypothetical protein